MLIMYALCMFYKFWIENKKSSFDNFQIIFNMI
jgi:hypothetical protein